MHSKNSWVYAPLIAPVLVCAVLAGIVLVGVLLMGFRSNPAAQPQRVSDLVARIEALERESRSQRDALDALAVRVDALEELDVEPDAIAFDTDVVIPRSWTQSVSGDGVVRYWHDPAWELANDEPGTLDLWLDDETSLFFAWDWSADLLTNLHEDERFFTLFEEDLVWSDDSIQMEIAAKGALEFMGHDAHYWDINMQSQDGRDADTFYSRMLIIFYPCSELASCNVTLMVFSEDAQAVEIAEGFSQTEWDFLNTFARGVEFLNEDKASMNANANLRSCPATDCPVVGRLVRGEIVEVVAVSEDGEWLQLESGEWVAADSVTGAPRDLPVVRDSDDV